MKPLLGAPPRHFLDLWPMSASDLRAVLEEAKRRKQARRDMTKGAVDADRPLDGHVLAMIFQKNSTRTRVSFEVGMHQLGGSSIVLNANDTQLGRGETVEDTARVLSRMVDAVMIRANSHNDVTAFASAADVPVINGLTDMSHPCQILADLMTIEERLGDVRGRTIAWTGDGNNVLASFIHAAPKLGYKLAIATPPNYAPRTQEIEAARKLGAQIMLAAPEKAVEGAPVRGRYARLGDKVIDPILRRHDYPRPVALLLGEALTLAALVGSLFKEQGRLTVQAEGKGDVPLLVAEYRSEGTLRGYARIEKGAVEKLRALNSSPPGELLGAGALVMTLDSERARHQGVVPLLGDTLSECAEGYFAQSEQTPTRIKLAVGEHYARGERPALRSGGALLQQIAGDDLRGDTLEAWRRSEMLFETLTDAELADPALPADRALYRLFHEDGVRMGEPSALIERCHCDRDRLTALLSRFGAEEMADLIEPDGLIHAHCEFCSRLYLIAPEDLVAKD